jgi:hypothetical protein
MRRMKMPDIEREFAYQQEQQKKTTQAYRDNWNHIFKPKTEKEKKDVRQGSDGSNE